jgi:hypothetical protein
MLRALLSALFKALRRDLAGYASLKTNNFFLFVLLIIWGALVSGVYPVAAYPFLLLLAVLMLFPLSGSLLDKVPKVRLALWPLTPATRAILWLFGARSVATVRPPPRIGPPGLIANNIRQMLSVLDTYLALFIGVSGGLLRLLGGISDPAAFPILAMLAGLALSTYAQSLFALDGEGGLTRYHLLPLTLWRIVLAKDAAYLAVLLVIVLPLSIVPGLAFGLIALALGRYPAMRLGLLQQRWRFTSGRALWGVLQCVAGAAAGFAGAWHVALVLYLFSLWWAARR